MPSDNYVWFHLTFSTELKNDTLLFNSLQCRKDEKVAWNYDTYKSISFIVLSSPSVETLVHS